MGINKIVSLFHFISFNFSICQITVKAKFTLHSQVRKDIASSDSKMKTLVLAAFILAIIFVLDNGKVEAKSITKSATSFKAEKEEGQESLREGKLFWKYKSYYPSSSRYYPRYYYPSSTRYYPRYYSYSYPSRSYDHYHDRYGRPSYTTYRYRRDVDEDDNEENESAKIDEAERLSLFEREDFEEASLDHVDENIEEQEDIKEEHLPHEPVHASEKEDFEEASLQQLEENTEEQEIINEKEDFEKASLNRINENTAEQENIKEVRLPQEPDYASEQELLDEKELLRNSQEPRDGRFFSIFKSARYYPSSTRYYPRYYSTYYPRYYSRYYPYHSHYYYY